jgi:hypothetical protein
LATSRVCVTTVTVSGPATTVTVPATPPATSGLRPPQPISEFGYIKSLTRTGNRFELRFDPAWFLTAGGGPMATPVTVSQLAQIVHCGSHLKLFEPITTGFWIAVNVDSVRVLDQEYRA